MSDTTEDPEPDSVIVNGLRCIYRLSLFIMSRMSIYLCDQKLLYLYSYSCRHVVNVRCLWWLLSLGWFTFHISLSRVRGKVSVNFTLCFQVEYLDLLRFFCLVYLYWMDCNNMSKGFGKICHGSYDKSRVLVFKLLFSSLWIILITWNATEIVIVLRCRPSLSRIFLGIVFWGDILDLTWHILDFIHSLKRILILCWCISQICNLNGMWSEAL